VQGFEFFTGAHNRTLVGLSYSARLFFFHILFCSLVAENDTYSSLFLSKRHDKSVKLRNTVYKGRKYVSMQVVIKVIFEQKDDIEPIVHALEAAGYTVVATSRVIFDPETKKYHQFLSVMNDGPA
jgi:hypothetical protein